MTYSFIISFVCAILLVSCTGKGPDSSEVRAWITGEFLAGNFIELKEYRDSIVKLFTDNDLIQYSDSLILIAERIEDDFNIDQQELNLIIERQRGINDPMQIDEWEDKGWLEYRIINGRKMYFNRAVSNLWLLRRFYEKREQSEYENSHDPRMQFRRIHDSLILAASNGNNLPVQPVEMKISYTLTVEPDAVPAGETVRCWLPWPKGFHPRQDGPQFISASESTFTISPDTSAHSSFYMEKPAVKGQPVTFRLSYIYSSSGQSFLFDSIKVLPYDKDSDLYKKYTSENPPQITFNDQVRHLAGLIPTNKSDPKVFVRNLYLWFKENVTWTGALEYSTMPDIPAYVFNNRRGDCGMQTFLFMSVLRYMGIPVKWQSGWMMPPGAENLHDWCEVWFEGTGWVPVDVSYDLLSSDNNRLREFYLGGIDSYRMIVNDDISGQFFPPRKYLRSDPFDFQRGEVEWREANLYYDKWDYQIEIEYLDQPAEQ